MRDLVSSIGAALVVAPAVFTGANTSAAVDTDGFGSLALVISTGAIVGAGDFSIKLQESDQTGGGTFTDVADEHLQGELPSTLAADAVVRVGYIGDRRYVRTVLARAGGTSVALAAVAIKGRPRHTPAV